MENVNSLLPYVRLRFNIDHPDLEECYVYGYECAKADIPEEENPYSEESVEHEQWQEGWWAGFYDEEPLYSPSKASTKVENIKQKQPALTANAANNQTDHPLYSRFLFNLLRLTGALAATAVVGYQVIDLVA